MKKIIPFFAVALFGLLMIGCTSDDEGIAYVDYDTYPVVYDVNNVNFENVGGSFQIARTFNTPMYETDMLLAYKRVGTTNNNAPIWQQIPITIYLEDGNEVDYNYDFSRYDFVIYAGGTFPLNNTEFVLNQTFRILLVPADYAKNSGVDFTDYNSVINHYNIDDSNPKEL